MSRIGEIRATAQAVECPNSLGSGQYPFPSAVRCATHVLKVGASWIASTRGWLTQVCPQLQESVEFSTTARQFCPALDRVASESGTHKPRPLELFGDLSSLPFSRPTRREPRGVADRGKENGG